jgi:hypothetical protein
MMYGNRYLRPRPQSPTVVRPAAPPAKKPPVPVKTTAKKKAYAGAKRGPKERPEWEAIARRLKTLRNTNKLPDRNAAFHAVKDWLARKGRVMANDTIYKGIDRHCADWWDESVTGSLTGK